VDFRELFTLAAREAGIAPPKTKIPLFVLYAMAAVADVTSFFTRKDNRFSVASIRCSTLLPNVDSSKAQRELGWRPAPIEQSVAEAVHYYLAHP
jgi:dihydroflavonol-4-reductase